MFDGLFLEEQSEKISSMLLEQRVRALAGLKKLTDTLAVLWPWTGYQ
jgi:hypothetical protein